MTRRAAAAQKSAVQALRERPGRAGPGVQSWAGRPGQVEPGVQPLAEVPYQGQMVARISAGTAAGGIPHVHLFPVHAFRRHTHARFAGHERCRPGNARAFSRGQRDQPATARAGAWRERCPREIARACSWRQRRRALVCTCTNPTACRPPENARAFSWRQRAQRPVCPCMSPAAGSLPAKCTSWLAVAASPAGICTGHRGSAGSAQGTRQAMELPLERPRRHGDALLVIHERSPGSQTARPGPAREWLSACPRAARRTRGRWPRGRRS
jgi:hypothetical protein